MNAPAVAPRGAVPVSDGASSDEEEEDEDDDDLDADEAAAEGATGAAGAAHARRVTALLEGLLPRQRNEYLQQLYTTPEFSTCPLVGGRIFVTPAPEAAPEPPPFTRRRDAAAPDAAAAAGPLRNTATKAAKALTSSKRLHRRKKGGAAPATAAAAGVPPQGRAPLRFPDGFTNFTTAGSLGSRRHPPPAPPPKRPVKAKKRPLQPAARAAAAAAAALPPNPCERGVTMRPSGKWQAQMYFAGKSRYIGVFDSRDKALAGYEIARKILKPVNLETDELTPQLIERCVSLARKNAFDGVNEMFANGRAPPRPRPESSPSRGPGSAKD